MAHSLVRFKTRYSLYNAGEVAGFDPAAARDLVENRQVADYETEQPVQTEAPTAPPVDKAVRAPKVRK